MTNEKNTFSRIYKHGLKQSARFENHFQCSPENSEEQSYEVESEDE